MSIINLEKTFENGQLVYCNLDNKIIECNCLSELSKYSVDYYNEDLGTFICNKVKVITIYDIYKNIIYEPIQINLLKDPIKNDIILENLKEYIYFFKTFIGAFIKNNKLNGIKYYLDYKGTSCEFLYDNIKLTICGDIRIFNIYNNEREHVHEFEYTEDLITYQNYNDEIKYIVYNSYIVITKGLCIYHQTIYFHKKNLRIFKIHYRNIEEEVCEIKNDNNEIIYLCKYDNAYKIKEKFISNDILPPFSKPLKKDFIELIDYYNKNINNSIELIKPCLKKEKEICNNLLLNCKLEIINSK